MYGVVELSYLYISICVLLLMSCEMPKMGTMAHAGPDLVVPKRLTALLYLQKDTLYLAICVTCQPDFPIAKFSFIKHRR